MSVNAFDVITGGQPVTDDLVLSSVFEIEGILIHLQKLNSKLEHAKGLKKYRIETADIEIKSLQKQTEQLRSLIQSSMFALTTEKTLQYPSVAKVSRRKSASTWKIVDENKFLAYVKSNHADQYDEVVKTKITVDTRVAKKLIDDWAESGENVPGVTKIEGTESISIAFDDNERLSKVSTISTPPKPSVASAGPQTLPQSDYRLQV